MSFLLKEHLLTFPSIFTMVPHWDILSAHWKYQLHLYSRGIRLALQRSPWPLQTAQQLIFLCHVCLAALADCIPVAVLNLWSSNSHIFGKPLPHYYFEHCMTACWVSLLSNILNSFPSSLCHKCPLAVCFLPTIFILFCSQWLPRHPFHLTGYSRI